MAYKAAIFILVILIQTALGCIAAEVTDPGAVLRQSVENNDFLRLKKESQEKKVAQPNVEDNTENPQGVPAKGALVKIFVRQIVVDSSKILTAEEIRAVAAKYENRDVTIQELYALVQELNDLYAKKKMITAKAILPPQKVEQGIVRIQLVESNLGKVLVEGNKNTNRSFYTNRVSLREGEFIRLDTLDRDIAYFNRTNDVQMRAELRPGTVSGTTDIILKADEPANIGATLFADNAGRKETGLYRYGLMLESKSLFGFRDAFAFTPIWTTGTTAWSASYNFPINRWGTRLGFGYDKNQTSIISGPFESLDVKSRLSDRSITLSHPMVVKADHKFDLFSEMHEKKSGNDFFGVNLIANAVKTTVLGATFQTTDDEGFWYSRYDTTRGSVDAANLFVKYNLSLVRQQKMTADRYFTFRLAGQYRGAGHSFPSSEQFSVGGMSTVRGFTEGALAGDQGYFTSLEWNFPLEFSDKVRGIAFIDNGGAFPYRGSGGSSTHRDYLTSVGVGAIINLSKYSSTKITIGNPIDPPGGQKHIMVHFFIQSVLL
ncbi:MAG: ShlB/FhaC/HecB family hemolysin secretion/activation protein [Negativicutes bacterium]|nr:ShlB/FhaC/HecB family hemolysin secretion/activation protein [Negativicutes bacterium]